VSQSDFVTRGQALVSAGQFQEAVKVCRLGLLGRPTTVEGRVVLGQALLALKRFDEVLAEMRVALELDHTSIAAQVLKGEALLRKGDHHAAVEALQKVRTLAPTDPRVAQLLAEAERATGKPRISASHPAVGFVGGGGAAGPADNSFAGDNHTKHYPNHADDAEPVTDGEDTGGSYTRPTSLSAPTAKKRSQQQPVVRPERTPSPAVLEVGDRSGTVDIDPDLEGVELDDDDFDDVAAPPAAAAARGKRPGSGGGRGRGAPAASVAAASAAAAKKAASPVEARKAARARGEISSVELADDDVMELDETSPLPDDELHDDEPPRPGPYTAVRNAVNQPAGPMADRPPPTAASMRATAHQAVPPPPHLAQLIANQPHVMHMAPVPMVPPAAPLPAAPSPRGAIAAALPTQAAVPVPQGKLFPAASVAAAAKQTIALSPQQQQQSAAFVDQLFGNEVPPPSGPNARTVAPWAGAAPAGSQMPRIGPDEATRQPQPIDPRIGEPAASGAAAAAADPMSQSGLKSPKTGMRRTRSRLQIVLWVLVGVVMIGGGVFAGFQIRSMRLGKQITAARSEAVTLAATDTWQGWLGARARLASVAQAQATLENRAALARTRAVLAFEFGDSLGEAQAALAELNGQGGLDAEIAAAFVALAQSDAKAAGAAADRALGLAQADPAAHYASGQASLLAGDLKVAIASLRTAVEKEPRAMYATGLARAYFAATSWDEGLAATDQALKATPDHPGALIVRGMLLAEGGRIVVGSSTGTEIRAQLDKIVREGTRPINEQPRGVSPAQVAFADLALAHVDAARGNVEAAKADLANAANVGLDEQRFAESAAETLYAVGLLPSSQRIAERALGAWPASLRARTTLAQIAIAQGRPAAALDLLGKAKDLVATPKGLAVRGAAKLASGDLDGAKADFDAALKRVPRLELAVIGRTWIDLRANELEIARKRVEPLYKPGATSPAIAIAYARVLRATGEPALRDKARGALEKLAAGGALIDSPHVQLEYGRVLRDLADFKGARSAFQDAGRAGNTEARLEAALLQIEDRDPMGGRQAIDELVKEAGERVTPALLVEAARARMLAGDNAGAKAAIAQLEKLPGTIPWQLDRERGRYALRYADFPGAAQMLMRALETCGDDAETFLLAAEVASGDKQPKLVEKLQALTKARLKDRPEASIVAGKLAIAEGKNDDADKAYTSARAALEKEKATPRRQAQAEFGRAVVAYNKQDDMAAQDALRFAIALDPTIVAAYLFLSDLIREKTPDKAFELAQQAVTFNPDDVSAWVLYGTLAHRLKKRPQLSEAITRVNDLAPGSEALRQLQSLR
jgi:tetratricopeptide (TPR) repeat protein